jgi:hypothetical protein
MVVVNSEAARHVGSSKSRPVAKRKHPIYSLVVLRLKEDVRGGFRRFEMNCDGAVAPGIFELMTPVSDKDKLHAELLGGLTEAASLVTQLTSEKQ